MEHGVLASAARRYWFVIIIVLVVAAETAGDEPTAEQPVAEQPSAVRPVDPAEVSFIPSNFDVGGHLIPSVIPESSAWEPTGNFRLTCSFSHLAYDDPIVYPGQPGKSHLHMFFGNRHANANSNYASLRTSGDSSCQGGPINRSAYWAPALFNAAGNVVIPDHISIYYKGPGRDTHGNYTDTTSLPAGLRMIAGQNPNNPVGDSPHDWYCELNQHKADTIPNCAAGERVGVSLAFPTCWNGTQLDAPDHRSHLAYMTRDPHTGQPHCPHSHPVPIPEFTLGIWFTHDNNSANWHLASDRMHGMPQRPNGSTFHSDWYGAWDPDIQNTWTTTCVNGLLNCKSGELGNGTSLSHTPDYHGPHTIPPP